MIFRALLPAFPERLLAGTKGMMCQAGFGSARRGEAATYTCFYETFAGGYGARFASDGPDAVQAHGQNTENAPIEETELNYPVRIARLALVENSEGAGPLPRRARPAQGLPLRPRDDASRSSPTATASGRGARSAAHDARVAEYVLIRGGAETRLGSKVTVELEPGDVISVRTCGGGGYGPPEEREPAAVRARRRARARSSLERARDVYRVALRDGAVDEAATAELRA